MNIAVFDSKSYDVESLSPYQGKDGINYKFFEAKLNEDTVTLAKGFDGVCVFVNDNVNAYVITKLYEYGCRIIALRCAGFNNVDIDYARGRIAVARVPAYSPHAVAEHAMAMLLTSVRRIHKAYIRTRDYNFSLNGLTGFDLYGKTVGIIGTGRIGSAFADICNGFGMNVLAYDSVPNPRPDIKYVTKDELFERSDIISLHCPLSEETHHLINAEALCRMKKGVIIINTSRGALIDTECLVKELLSRRIGGACLDVYEEEGDIFYEDKSGHIMNDEVLARLISMPNVIVTSHQGFLTKEALSNIAQTTHFNIKSLE